MPKKQTLKEQNWYGKGAHKRWRRLVMQRDNWLCQECKRKGRTPIPAATEAHHIIPIEERPDLALDVDNGEALCWQCHETTKIRNKKKTKLPVNVRIVKA